MLSTSLSLHQLPVALLLSLVATTEVSALVPPTEPALAHAPSSLRGTPTNRQRSELGGSISLPLKKRHAPSLQSGGDVGAWAKRQGDRLLARYNPAALAKRNDQADSERRGLGHNLITDQGQDNSYFGSLAVGTPPIAYDVTLDTGSSDLWLASTGCVQGCTNISLYEPGNSTSYTNLNKPFSISYGSGDASGGTGNDTVQMAGFEIPGQIFGTVTTVTDGLISDPVSGLLGLGWQSLASTSALPFWQALAAGGVWDDPLMGFAFTRFHNITDAEDIAPGGMFTMGYLNQSLYSGEIEYSAIPKGKEGYWLIPLDSVGVDGSRVVNQTSFAAIDTGTTLIGGPAASIAAIFSHIPGAYKGTGNYDGYYVYPCATPITVSFTFAPGGVGYQNITNGVASSNTAWTVDPGDFMLQKISPTECLGSLFVVDGGNDTIGPDWIIGDTFLKNVFSVFQYNPPAVGFARLSSAAATLMYDAIPSATIGTQLVRPTNGATTRAAGMATMSVAGAVGCALVGVLVGGYLV